MTEEQAEYLIEIQENILDMQYEINSQTQYIYEMYENIDYISSQIKTDIMYPLIFIIGILIVISLLTRRLNY